MSCSKKNETSWQLVNPSGEVIESGTYVDELGLPFASDADRPPTGTLRSQHYTGFKSEETWETKNGELFIKSVTWDPQGRLYTRYQARDGYLNGFYEQYWEGKPTESGAYLNGRKIGEWTEWHARSATFVQNTYKDGELWDGQARLLVGDSGFDITRKQGETVEMLPCEAYLVPKRFGERHEE